MKMIKFKKPSGTIVEINDQAVNIAAAAALGWKPHVVKKKARAKK